MYYYVTAVRVSFSVICFHCSLWHVFLSPPRSLSHSYWWTLMISEQFSYTQLACFDSRFYLHIFIFKINPQIIVNNVFHIFFVGSRWKLHFKQTNKKQSGEESFRCRFVLLILCKMCGLVAWSLLFCTRFNRLDRLPTTSKPPFVFWIYYYFLYELSNSMQTE